MKPYKGKPISHRRAAPFWLVPLSFFSIELFSFFFLSLDASAFTPDQLWPLAFGGLWAVILGAGIRLLPAGIARVLYGLAYGFSAVYAGFQTGYYVLFSEMMWLSDFRYAAEGSDYADVLLSYPLLWWLGILLLILQGVLLLVFFPRRKRGWWRGFLALTLACFAGVGACFLPEVVFLHDSGIKYAGSDYGRAQSAEAAYDNMFNTHRLYQVCGLYQTLVKDVYAHYVYPMTPSHARAQREAQAEIRAYLDTKPDGKENSMTGRLKGRNVVLVLMESMDDWLIGEHTPTISRLMEEGINFTSFYTPVYGGIRTFNTEFCVNTGSFLSSQGGYAFDYVTNTYDQSLASQLREAGYSTKTFHYNDPTFYSRGEFSPAMGYEEYVCYAGYLGDVDEDTAKNMLYDDLLLFDNQGLKAEFFREGQPTLNFVITRSAHLSYKYNEVLSHWGLKKYPQYRGLTGNEETDCALLKAKLVDDFFARLLEELEANGTLYNTVIIGVTDHYTYGYKDEESLLKLSGVNDLLLLEKTPCFIWSQDIEAVEVKKMLNTADLLPTVLNILGVESEYGYIGTDAFNAEYLGFVPFSDGSWMARGLAYDAGAEKLISVNRKAQLVTAQFQQDMARKVEEFVRINNLILETDYYKN